MITAWDVAGAVYPLPAAQRDLEHPDRAVAAFFSADLVPDVHRDARAMVVTTGLLRNTTTCTPPAMTTAGSARRSSGLDVVVIGGWWRPPAHAASSPDGAAGWFRPYRAAAATVRASGRQAREYTEVDISPYFWHNGRYPDSEEYRALLDGNFVDYRLRVNGLVDNPRDFDLEQLRALPVQEQITQHFCIQGWSGIAKWVGCRCKPSWIRFTPTEAKWVVFYSSVTAPMAASTTTRTDRADGVSPDDARL